jgi:hypothetical protein
MEGVLFAGTLIGWVRHNKTVVPWDVSNDGDMAVSQSQCRRALAKHGARVSEISNNANTSTFDLLFHHQMLLVLEKFKSNLSSADAKDFVRYQVTQPMNRGFRLGPGTVAGCENQVYIVQSRKCKTDILMLASDAANQSRCSCARAKQHRKPPRPGEWLCMSPGECAPADAVFPGKPDIFMGGEVLIPNNVEESLAFKYPHKDGIKFRNLKRIHNPKWSTHRLVLGYALPINSSPLLPPPSASSTLKSEPSPFAYKEIPSEPIETSSKVPRSRKIEIYSNRISPEGVLNFYTVVGLAAIAIFAAFLRRAKPNRSKKLPKPSLFSWSAKSN